MMQVKLTLLVCMMFYVKWAYAKVFIDVRAQDCFLSSADSIPITYDEDRQLDNNLSNNLRAP